MKAIFNRNRNFQRQPRPNFPCMGSSNRNHHRNLQDPVTVAVDQNILIFGGRFGHQRRGPTLLLSENCDSTEKDWTDRSLRVWVEQQPRPGCTSRLRLKIAVVDGTLRLFFIHLLIEEIKVFTYINLCIISCKLKLTLFNLIYGRENEFNFIFTAISKCSLQKWKFIVDNQNKELFQWLRKITMNDLWYVVKYHQNTLQKISRNSLWM